MTLKRFITTALLMAVISFTPVLSEAQDFPDPDDDPPPTDVPFDGGVSLLIAAGVAYGVKKKYDQRKMLVQE